MYDCIIIGSGPAGMTASIYMCRAGYKTALITGSEIFGSLGKISSIENYPGIDQISGYNLATKMYEQLDKYHNLTKFEFLNVKNYSKYNDIIEVELDDESKIKGKCLIIAIGGKHRTLGLENETNFFNKGISFCATCDGPMYKDKDVAIIGGGNSAMDFALTLSKYCHLVSIFHRRDAFRADKTMIEKVQKLKNVTLFKNSTVDSIMEQDNKFLGLNIKCKGEEKLYHFFFDGCFYALGFEKNNIECINNDDISNSINNIFYAGDCIDEKYRQVITACGDGCKAALDCVKYLQEKGN